MNMLNRLFKGLVVVGTTLLVSSCVDRVGDNQFNIIQGGGSSDSLATAEIAEGSLKAAMPLIHDSREHKYQYQFNLHIDNYAGYLVVANSLQGRIPRTYSPNTDFQTGPITSFLWIAQQVVPVMNSAEKLQRPELGAIASIIFNFAASEVVDVYGPLPYSDYKRLKQEPPMTYQTVEEVYGLILEDLKLQQQKLKDLLPLSATAQQGLQNYDKICGGDVNKWIKFANSIRLRMAMRMSKVAPDRARSEFESAVADGVFVRNDDDVAYQLVSGKHPLYTISEQWDDTRLNANLYLLMARFHHPLLEQWFTKIGAGLKDEEGRDIADVYAPMRAGMATFRKESEKFASTYKLFSKVSSNYAEHNIPIFKTSEVFFLLAEGALRGWNAGTSARNAYQLGISESFRQENGAGNPGSYIRQTAAQCPPLDYIDYVNPAYSSPAAQNGSQDLGVQWDDSFDNEKKLEMIITQKYIANFPLSLEAWSDFRRTGYPQLIANDAEDTGDTSIPPRAWIAPNGKPTPSAFIRRIPFVRTGSVDIKDINGTALPALQQGDPFSIFSGRDFQATPLWWDVPTKGNFD